MSTIKSSTTTTTAYSVTADTTGTLVLQTGATPTTAVTVGTDQSVTFAGTLAVQSQNMTPYTGFKNRIINGAMNVWQRGTSYSGTPSTTTYGSADRWGFFSVSPLTASQSTSVPSGFQYSLKLQRPNAAVTTVNLYALQVVESNNMIDLQGQSVTLSFWAKAGANFSASSNTLNFAINSGTVADQGANSSVGGGWTGSTYPIITTATLTTTWTKYTATGTIPSNSLEVSSLFWFTPTGTAGADDAVYITGVQLEKGSTATSFDYRPYGTELALCQRYALGFTTSQGLGAGLWYLAGYVIHQTQFPVQMRSAPTITTNTAVGRFYIVGTSVNSTAGNITITVASISGCEFLTTVSGGTAGQGTSTAVSSGLLILSSEL
jgi:hypothetical protein